MSNKLPPGRRGRREPLARAGLYRARLRSRQPFVLVRGEHVRTLVVSLPVRSAAKRRAAAVFAVEEALATPLDGVSVGLGQALGGDRYLVAVADRERLDIWRVAMAEAGLRGARLVPEYLMLPPPPDEGTWTVWRGGDRILARRSDRTGFATDPRTFAMVWRAAGEPALLASGDDVADAAPGARITRRPRHAPPDTAFAGIDLAPSEDARTQGVEIWGWAKAASVTLVFGALAHGAIGVADLRALEAMERERRAGLDAVLDRFSPGGMTVEDAVARLSMAEAQAPRTGFLETLALASAALSGLEDGVSVQSLAYDDGSGALDLDLVLDDLPALQRAEAALAGAGLSPVPGAATSADGATEARIRVSTPGREGL